MDFKNEEIKQEYNRIIKENKNIDGLSHPFINVDDTLKAYFTLADYFSDQSSEMVEPMFIGVRSIDLLCSALGRQNVSFGNRAKYTTPIEICSTLFYGMVKNHSFQDGNKRTALLILLYQLNLYNYLPSSSVKEYEKLVVSTAANTLKQTHQNYWNKHNGEKDQEVQTIAHFLRKHTKKKDNTYHVSMTMSDMNNALKKYDVESKVDNGKIQFSRVVRKGIFRKAITLQYTVVFGGWTRAVGANTAREILKNLDLYHQFPDYKSFLDGNATFYSLISQFEGPFRRLKDE